MYRTVVGWVMYSSIFISSQAVAAENLPVSPDSAPTQAMVLDELAIIDANLQNKAQLKQDILNSRSAGRIHILELNADTDGITQITGHLRSARQTYKAVHVFAHGAERKIQLGNSALTDKNLGAYTDQLAAWSGFLGDEADVLLYSCQLAGDQSGIDFVKEFSGLIQADVAASDNITGTLGDWQLEFSVGAIDVAAVVPEVWQGNLIDSDGDGADDLVDNDDDNDGIPDSVEGSADPDGDGLPNSLDTDSDNDQLSDGDEAGVNLLAPVDTDGDGAMDFVDTDSDNDGIPDSVETAVQLDGDGIPNYLDLDSDNDGIPDRVEAGVNPLVPVDTDGDGRADFIELDSDNDLIPDAFEAGADPAVPSDTDADSLPDYIDLDSDNDAIFDNVEAGDTPSLPVDTDGDGDSDFIDLDSDGDRIPDSLEGVSDTDSDGLPDYLDWDADNDSVSDLLEAGSNPAAPVDSDGDSLADFLDTDSDGDGIPDLIEAATNTSSPADTDGDGVADYLELDSDADGIPDSLEAGPNPQTPVDTDADSLADFIDTDADADGIPDSVEAGTSPLSPLDTDSDGSADYIETDSDGDGIPDVIEAGRTPTAPVDSDGDGLPDNRDLDSDNDRIPDQIEAGFNAISPSDTDSDGLADYLDTDSDDDDIPDTIEAGTSPSSPTDSDRDGLADFIEIDSDNDGISDTVEAGSNPLQPLDSDADGLPDYTELDSDNDGVSDTAEAGPNLTVPTDSDNDGTPDYQDVGTDADGDGIPDTIEQTADQDGDGAPNYLDLDSDDDGIPDEIEIARDTDGDSLSDFLDEDSDNDGISDSVEAAGDTDGDTVADYRDLDSDNDGVFDLVEAIRDQAAVSQLDADTDGVIDTGNPTGSNGMADVLETTADSGEFNYDLSNTDGDSAADFRDLDSDNDGLTDSFETDQFVNVASESTDVTGRIQRTILNVDANGLRSQAGVFPRDTDRDAVADFRDLDSDNDGVGDIVESFGVDDNLDGMVDSFLDENGNGFDDVFEATMSEPFDSDSDGIVDAREIDSDADGIADLVESAGDDVDGNGTIDQFNDADNNGLDDNLGAQPRAIVDSDNDGLPDFQDPDSDNDGISDFQESGGTDLDGDNRADSLTAVPSDRNGDGIPDYRQGDAVLTGLGGGGCSMMTAGSGNRIDPTLAMTALLAFAFIMLRRLQSSGNRKYAFLCGAVLLGGCTTIGPSTELQPWGDEDLIQGASEPFARGVYVTGGIGSSRLEPDTSQVEPFLQLNNRVDPAAQVGVGYDVSENFAVEGHAAELGSAGVSSGGEIKYRVSGVSGLVYVGANRARFKRQGLTSYGRVGVGYMDNSTEGNVTFRRVNKNHFLFGAGVEYMTNSGFGARLEGVFLDEDAKFAQVAMMYRFGDPQYPELPVYQQYPDLPADPRSSELYSELPQDQGYPEPSEIPQTSGTIETPSVLSQEPATNNNSCDALAGVLDGVGFLSGSAELTDESMVLLSDIASKLVLCSTVSVEIKAHTDSTGTAEANQALSARRAKSVARQLYTGGVSVSRLSARAFGESVPIDSNETEAGRARNRRVELVLN